MKVIKAIYNFIVGDMIILVGVLLVILLLALVDNRSISGLILVLAILTVLSLTLLREARGKR